MNALLELSITLLLGMEDKETRILIVRFLTEIAKFRVQAFYGSLITSADIKELSKEVIIRQLFQKLAKKGIYGENFIFCDFENTAIDIQIIALDTMIELTASSGMSGKQVSN